MLRLFCLLWIIFAGMVNLAEAHRQHRSDTEISYNHRTRQLEIIHIVYGHDLQRALDLEGIKTDIYQDTDQTRNAIKAYFDAVFILGKKKKNSLKFIGYEHEGDIFYIYYEAYFFLKPKAFELIDNIFLKLYHDQVNQVSLIEKKDRKTIQFTVLNERKKVKMPK